MERKKMTIELNATEGQAIALNEMFKRWNQLSSMGGSRHVAFFVDGDGDFHPKAKVTSEWDLKANEDLGIFATNKYKNHMFYMDYDPVYSMLNHRRNNSEEFVQEQIKTQEEKLKKDFGI